MEAFKKLTEEVKAYLSTKEYADTIEKTKGSDDTGTFEVIISTSDQDRQGEIVDQNGWDLRHFMANPIVLWAHDYSALPIGVADEVKLVDGKLTAKGRFASMEANPFAQQVRRLYEQGIVKTTSVGFIAKRMEGNTITESELLEFSFVPVPANPYAISMRTAKELGLDLAMLAMKGMQIKEVDETPSVEGEPVAEGDDTPETPSSEEISEEKEGETETVIEPVEASVPTEPTIAEVMDEIKALKSQIAALTAKSEEGDEGEVATPEKVEPPKDEENDESVVEAMDKWLKDRVKVADPEARKLLVIINNVTSEALAQFNKGKNR